MAQDISPATYNRMQGLASIKQMQNLNAAIDQLVYDWLKEGFDPQDVQAFMAERTNEIIDKNK